LDKPSYETVLTQQQQQSADFRLEQDDDRQDEDFAQ